MNERARRIGANEALFRTVNEEIETLSRDIADFTRQPMRVVCECGDLRCSEQLNVAVDEYERIRSDATLFFVKPGHETTDVETPVEQTDEYVVVRKHSGAPADVARVTDPRS